MTLDEKRKLAIEDVGEMPQHTFGSNGITTLDLLQVLNDCRLNPMKPNHTKVQYSNGNFWITDECPCCCGNPDLSIWDRLITRTPPARYCKRCGQAIDWSEYDSRDSIDWEEYMKHTAERTEQWLKYSKMYEDGTLPR